MDCRSRWIGKPWRRTGCRPCLQNLSGVRCNGWYGQANLELPVFDRDCDEEGTEGDIVGIAA